MISLVGVPGGARSSTQKQLFNGLSSKTVTRRNPQGQVHPDPGAQEPVLGPPGRRCSKVPWHGCKANCMDEQKSSFCEQLPNQEEERWAELSRFLWLFFLNCKFTKSLHFSREQKKGKDKYNTVLTENYQEQEKGVLSKSALLTATSHIPQK